MHRVVLLIARQEQLQVGDQVIARVTGTEARLPNFEVQKLQKFPDSIHVNCMRI